MGIILSRFRKKKTTIEILETLDSQIKEIEEYGQTTEQKHKKIVGTLLIYSVILYVITAVVFYFYFFPASLYDQLFYITPLLIFPLLIIFTKKLVTWYYKRKISRNQSKLVDMQKEKKKILDEVTETETYKKAKEILLKFAPDQLRMTSLTPQVSIRQPTAKTPSTPLVSPQLSSTRMPGPSTGMGGTDLRKRAITATSPMSLGRPMNSGLAPIGFGPANAHQLTPVSRTPVRNSNAQMLARSPLPRPILSQQRSYLDRLVEYLVGDGPSNRYALICRQCDSHNGMALKEEFEYFGFRCCYCNYWNPARKQKPSAPKLESNVLTPLAGRLQSDPIGDNDSTSSGTDSDIEVVEKPENDVVESEDVELKTSVDSQNVEKVEDILNETPKVEELTSEKMDVDESPRK